MSTPEQDIIKAFIDGEPAMPKASGFVVPVLDAVRKAKQELDAHQPEKEDEQPVRMVTERDKNTIRAAFGLPGKSASRRKAELAYAKSKPYVPLAMRGAL